MFINHLIKDLLKSEICKNDSYRLMKFGTKMKIHYNCGPGIK